MRIPPYGCRERLNGLSVWKPTIFSLLLSRYPGPWDVMVEIIFVSISRTPPFSRSCADRSITCSHSAFVRSEEHTSELQSRFDLVCRLLLEKKNNKILLIVRHM